MFFDRNKDGVIYPWETFQGKSINVFVQLGQGFYYQQEAQYSSTLASAARLDLYVLLSPGKFPSPLFPIEIKNIQRGKHGSDSGAYDSQGRFVPEKFEEIFAKHAKTNRHALTSEELGEMLKSNREPKNYSGWLASYSEWKILFHLGKDKNGLLQKDTVRSVYDGSLFERMENEKHLSNKP
ncbi:Probable peroxygenase 4 [Linum perenne]